MSLNDPVQPPEGIALKIAAALGLVGALLIAWLVLFPDAETTAEVATVPASTTTTTTPPAIARIAQAPEAVATETTSSVAPLAVRDPGHPGVGLDAAQPAATVTDNADAATAATATTTAPVSGPAPVTISRPSCAAGLGAQSTKTAPFTGLSASIHSGMPAVVVKVSNNSAASRRTLIGLDQADIVFEERIEASATRFFSVFHSTLPANVGPVRSGRTTDIQLTQNLNRPVFAYSGSNAGVSRQIKFAADNGILTPFINTDRAPFARDSRYSAPDNLFVDPASLGACGGSGNPTSIFSYGSASSTTAKSASSVSLSARSPYRFDWNGSRWVRSQDGYAHTTREGTALAPTNVVVLFVPYVQSQIDAASVDAQTIGSGSAWVFRDGTVTEGSWVRGKGHEPYSLTDGSGTAVRLAPGQTWVVLAPAGSASYN